MTNDKVNEVLVGYVNEFTIQSIEPIRTNTSRVDQTTGELLSHAHWMCHEAMRFGPERIEKKMRWLGFIQGVRFCTGFDRIDSMKRDNMPEGETFKA